MSPYTLSEQTMAGLKTQIRLERGCTVIVMLVAGLVGVAAVTFMLLELYKAYKVKVRYFINYFSLNKSQLTEIRDIV
jgi:hypothetical protein